MKISANPAANDPEPEVAFLGVHHAREMISGVATMHLLHTLADGYAANKPQIRKLVDTREVWVIPVVNPNGYDRAAIDNIAWRKNTRWEKGQMKFCGVDINRNYAFDHVTNFPAAQRAQLPSVGIPASMRTAASTSNPRPTRARPRSRKWSRRRCADSPAASSRRGKKEVGRPGLSRCHGTRSPGW
jgi:murein tripeptide amidase MpaA